MGRRSTSLAALSVSGLLPWHFALTMLLFLNTLEQCIIVYLDACAI